MGFLGIDIGGSGIKGALVDINSGELVSERYRLPTPEGGMPDDIAEVVRDLVQHFNYTGTVGCGFPAVVTHGVVRTAANIAQAWIGTNVDDLLSKITGNRVVVANDADVAGLAEMVFGAGRNYRKGVVMMVTLGTGIGTALYVDGKLVPNTELGHLKIRDKDAEKRASDAVRKKKDLSWKEWTERLQELFDEYEALFWPDVFIIGGGVSKESENYLPLLKLRARIVPAQLLNQAGIVGAALYANDHED
jgi:polyphosphate glucokinase